MRLYYSRGACSVAVHIVLEEIGESYEVEFINLFDDSNLKPEFISINPRGTLPVLGEEQGYLRETTAILAHLALSYPKANLIPAVGTRQFALCLEWLSWIGTTPHEHLLQFWRPHRLVPSALPLDKVSQMARENFRADCREIEDALIGPWFFGESFTVVDAYLLFCYRQGNRIGLPMGESFPRFTEWAHRMLKRPAVSKVWKHEGISLGGDADVLTPIVTVSTLSH